MQKSRKDKEMKKAIVVGIMAVQVLIAHAAGESRVSCASEHVARGLAYCEQLRDGGKGAGLMAARARIEFMLALKSDRRNSEAYYQLGCLYRDVFGHTEQAMEQFEMFLRLSNESDGRWKQVRDKVLPELRKKVSMSAAALPGINSRDSANGAAELKKADGFMKKGELDDVARRYKAAYEADPLLLDTVLDLAQALESSGNEKDALKYYCIASYLRPYSTATVSKAGRLAMRQGKFAIAEDVFSRAVAVLPQNIMAIEALIGVLHKVGREDEAKVYRLYLSEIQRSL